jgi:hypothetical protein
MIILEWHERDAVYTRLRTQRESGPGEFAALFGRGEFSDLVLRPRNPDSDVGSAWAY